MKPRDWEPVRAPVLTDSEPIIEMTFTRAIVRQPGRSMVHGLTTAKLGPPDYNLALRQHHAYVDAGRECGLEVITLPPDEAHPDSCFVEDTALLTPECAIVMRPGAESRRGETEGMEADLRDFFDTIYHLSALATADAGDIMMVGRHYFIGLSQRTNGEGARQIIDILTRHDLTGSTIQVGQGLHLKSGVAYLENNNLLVTEDFRHHPAFAEFHHIPVSQSEQYAANSLWLNGTVLVPSGYPKTELAIRERGYNTLVVDTSEFRKLDGGLSCLSLRF